ncbi:alpha-amylase [Sphingomonas oleivorans]|uniref:Alpha-amylase n=2 Tax=Sphingomonas oleivorans TaxID=1735121 RepID=A0A2T5FTM3_9SPHN|nr:alpha-amylase [Sphingomonas oleivorans]
MALGLAAMLFGAPMAPAANFRDRLAQDELIYFVLPDRFENGDAANDRGGLKGDRLRTGFDPAAKGFYHGGDLKGLTARLDYIQGLGATAIWLGPIYKNKPVQGPPGQESAGYHGYWITDFTDVDPHFGTRADLKAFVDAAHARGVKVYLDIITNHTADVIRYRECPTSACAYRSLADYPYSTRGGVKGPGINAGFAGDDKARQTAANFARLTQPDYAYAPYVPAAEAKVKKPEWLNDPIWYHNRGDTSFKGESSTYGDFSGLDDLFTENPRVMQGFIDIYGKWIDDFGIDGFRIDTARHVNPEFWQAFVPAMIERAKARGIPNFHIFGEVADPDPATLARFTRVDRYPAVLDFGFQSAVTEVLAGKAGTDRLAELFQVDALYEGGPVSAVQLPTFLGNHDMGRFAHLLRAAAPSLSNEDLFKRVTLGHAMLIFARGAPVIYYGDEQGFTGDGGDQDAREDMFASKVASYNDNKLIGTDKTTATASFDPAAPLYRAISTMAAIRAADPALRRGEQIVRNYDEGQGLFAFSRQLADGTETLVVLNTSTKPVSGQIQVDAASRSWRSLHGSCAPAASARGSYAVSLAPLDYLVCTAQPSGEAR